MNQSLGRLLERNASADPDRVAVMALGEAWSHAELARRAARVAHVLGESGVRPGHRVGVRVQRSLTALAALHGVLRAGAAYVPVDPSAGPDRQAAVLRDAGARHLVTWPDGTPDPGALIAGGAGLEHVIGGHAQAPAPGLTVWPWDTVWAAPEAPVVAGASEDDLSYIIYTSGSTGVPKGIAHTHSSCLAFCRTIRDAFRLEPHDRLSHQSGLHFDMSIFEVFGALYAGATSVVVPERHLKLPASHAQLLASERVSVFFTVPSALTSLLLRGAAEDRDMRALRWVVFGGETIPTKHLAALMRLWPHARFHHMYGPAETNGCTGMEVPRLDPDDHRHVSIGGAYPGMEVRCVSETGQPVAVGEVGELWVRGPTTMRGYWARPDLNAGAFARAADDPEGEPFYRTGDVAERLPGQQFRFVGRRDRQIKTRGYRLDLGDVEAAFESDASVLECAAYAVPDATGTRHVAVAILLADGTGADRDRLMAHARQRLPAWALPQRVEVVQALPRAASGKIDYQTLERGATPGG